MTFSSLTLCNYRTFSYGALGLLGFAVLIGSIACMLVCYTERDTIDKQVFKSGTLANNQLDEISNYRGSLTNTNPHTSLLNTRSAHNNHLSASRHV